jgi:hypothetical protein
LQKNSATTVALDQADKFAGTDMVCPNNFDNSQRAV